MATDTSCVSPVAAPASPAALAEPTPAPDLSHDMAVTAAAHALAARLADRGVVQSRGPIRGVDGPVEVAVLVPREDGYRGVAVAPRGDRVLLGLVIAPADGSPAALRRLGAAGIEEVWVVDHATRCLQVHREADPTGYGDVRFLGPDEPVSPLAYPDLTFRGSDFLGHPPAAG